AGRWTPCSANGEGGSRYPFFVPRVGFPVMPWGIPRTRGDRGESASRSITLLSENPMKATHARARRLGILLTLGLVLVAPLAVGGKRAGHGRAGPGRGSPAQTRNAAPPAVRYSPPPTRQQCIQCYGRGVRNCYGCGGSGRYSGSACGACGGRGQVRCPS